MTERTLFTRRFWIDTFERSIWTFAEAAGGVLTVDIIRNAVTGGDWSSLYWTGGGVLLATGLAVLKAVGAAAKSDVDSASTAPAVIAQAQATE